MDFSFFLIDNKSGHKTREDWFSKNHSDMYLKLIQHCEPFNIPTFKEKIWFFFNGLTEKPKCSGCQGHVEFSGRFDRGYNDFCSLECANTKGDLLDRIKKTNQEKFGVDYYTQHSDFVEKQKKTKKERYGDENYNNHDKMLNTKKMLYGDSNYNNQNKIKKTSLERYGVVSPSKSTLVKEKIKKTNLDRYGFNSPTQNPQIKDKLYESILINIKDRFKNNEFIGYDFKTGIYTLKCDRCDSEYVIPTGLYNERNRLGYICCTECNPIGLGKTSNGEIEISDYLRGVGVENIILNNRDIIKQELDIFLPDYNLAIEYNGLYWHSEIYKNEKYHLDKTIKCNENGIELIHIFEDEWLFNRPIVESILKNRLGLVKNKIHARKCDVKLVDNKMSIDFLNNNHIQGGNCKNSIRLGLFYNDELVSLMTFSKPRLALGGKGEWELVRFCNKINTIVSGSASKLFNFFIKNYKPTTIVTYSDIRIFSGGLYDKLGFKEIHKSKPNYWYVIENKRYHRFNYRKSNLIKQGFDPDKTEKQIMFERKYYRIYDCGNVRWEYS